MVEPVAGTNRNITADNWFSSLSLVNNLLKKNLTYLGTVRKSRREIPQEFLRKKNREEKSSLFGFQANCTLVSYCPKKNRSVVLMSSMHHDDAIDEETRDDKKPVMVTDYNHTKIVIFYNLLNISGINALCVHKANHPQEKIKRNHFLEKCAWELIRPQLEVRSTIPQLPREMRRRAQFLLGIVNIPPPPPQQPLNYVGRCHICPRNLNKSSRKSCTKCGRFA